MKTMIQTVSGKLTHNLYDIEWAQQLANLVTSLFQAKSSYFTTMKINGFQIGQWRTPSPTVSQH